MGCSNVKRFFEKLAYEVTFFPLMEKQAVVRCSLG
jgi:hypothetical protein